MPAKRDVEALREFLVNHSVEGYRVNVPIFGPAVIERQISTGGGFVFYRVVAKDPVPFEEFASHLRVDDTPLDLEGWEEKFVAGKTKSLPPMAVDLMEQLEAGGRVSQKDVLFRELMDVGCMDENQLVHCYTFDSRQCPLASEGIRKGVAVEIQDGGQTGWAGVVVGVKQDTVLVEQFAPITFMQTPETIIPSKIKPGLYSSQVATLGPGLYEALEEAKVEIPPGQWNEDRSEYELSEALALREIERFCKSHYAKQEYCIYQALTLFILPMSPDATFFPLPEGLDPELYLVEYAE